MGHEYYYLGNSTALAKISGHDSYVCIDTNSWEALIYAQGYPIEPNEMSVMRRFLAPGDVFLDVGANFGVYTAVASETLAHSGRIFAFEANPHTYKFLCKTAQSNRLYWLDQHKFINVAIGSHDGETQFAYHSEALGGGHIPQQGEDTSSQKVVTVKMAALDSLLPQDLVVNFCKIDVEGHELGVLKGMVAVIHRSPQIRLLIEHYTGSDMVTPAGRAVVDYLRSLDLSVCVVSGSGTLIPLGPEEFPTGNVYLLATRSPQEDAARAVDSHMVRPGGLQFHGVFKNSAQPLLQADGGFVYRQIDHAQVEEPSLFFGPYMTLKAGRYQLRFVGASGSGAGNLTIVHGMGVKPLAAHQITDWTAPIPFSLTETVNDLEVVLRKTDSLTNLTFSSLTIERI